MSQPGSSWADLAVDLGLQGRKFSVIMAPSPRPPSCVRGTPPPALGGLWPPGLLAGHCWHSGWPAARGGLSGLCTALAASPAPPARGPQRMPHPQL